MKNIIIATTIATAAIFTLGAKGASAMDFNTEMQMKEIVGQYAPFLYIAHACDIEDKYILTDAVFDTVYEAFVQDVYDYNTINAEFKMPEFDYEFMQDIDFIKENRDAPNVVEFCDGVKVNAGKVLDELMEKA